MFHEVHRVKNSAIFYGATCIHARTVAELTDEDVSLTEDHDDDEETISTEVGNLNCSLTRRVLQSFEGVAGGTWSGTKSAGWLVRSLAAASQ